MDAIQGLLQSFSSYEASFNATPLMEQMAPMVWQPCAIAAAYVVLVFAGMAFMEPRQPSNPKLFFTLWNFGLAAFSIVGSVNLIPKLFSVAMNESERYVMCTPAQDWFYDGPVGFWYVAFIFSKVPEFVDTFFLVVRKRPVIFLHWYHHCTVMLSAWFGLSLGLPSALVFASMNYFVHAIMYSYYFMMSVPFLRPIAKPFAMSITLLQLAQMVVGLYVTVRTQLFLDAPDGASCGTNRTQNWAVMAMYGSYFVLFANFFYQSYIKGGKGGRKTR